MSQGLAPDPLYAGPRQAVQSYHDARNGSGARPTGAPSTDSGSIQSRAEKFDDEKRRIIESCFSKRDPEGTLLESYITHVRVVEDAAYPSSPPPPDSAASNKKHRMILVAVRKSGRVRVHKARENPSGSFSIGKTWPLDELSAIQSYAGLVPSGAEEAHHKQWASSVGFTVTMGKPYYWQAPTSKEKDFFIASVVKIFRKFTGGKLPELIGFTPAELQQLTGVLGPGPASRAVSDNQSHPQKVLSSGPSPLGPTVSDRGQPLYDSRPQNRNSNTSPLPSAEVTGIQNEQIQHTRDGQRTSAKDGFHPPSRLEPTTPGRDAYQTPRGEGPKYQPPPEQISVTRPSHEQMPSMPQVTSYLQATVPRPSVSHQSSQASFQPGQDTISVQRSRSNGLTTPPLPNEAGQRKLAVESSGDPSRIRGEQDAAAGSRPGTDVSERRPSDLRLDQSHYTQGPPPERRRPLMQNADVNFDQRSINSDTSNKMHTPQFHTPLGTPGATRPEDSIAAAPGVSSRDEPAQAQPPPKDYFADASWKKQGVAGTAASSAAHTSLDQTPRIDPGVASSSDVPQIITEQEQISIEKMEEEEHRPGLGPMIKKKSAKDIASTFRKAAFAATAFQPRQGGAGARLKAKQEKAGSGPDGITSVVPAPALRGMSTDSVSSSKPDVPTPVSEKERPFTPVSTTIPPIVQIQRIATEDSAHSPQAASAPPTDIANNRTRARSLDNARSSSPKRKRRQKHEAEIEKYCSSLGLDPRIMDGRGAEFGELLTEFGWDGRLAEDTKIEVFEAEVRREIGRAQATGWLGHIDQQEIKLQDLSKAFAKAIEECEELDGLLTLYSHELDTLHDDIQYIEAQSQGLQVQTANQKLLQNELHSLLRTLTISSSDLRGLHKGSFDTAEGVQSIEKSLAILYQAMITIDPEIRQNLIRQTDSGAGDRSVGVYADAELGQMRAVREKKDEYREETLAFLRRFNQHMTYVFKRIEQRTSEENSRSNAHLSASSLELKGHQSSRQELWIFSALMLFVREVNTYEWQTLIASYEMNIKSTYLDHFRENVMAGKKVVRQTTGEEQDILFTAQEKEKHDDSIASTAARKLTVKRVKTHKANALRNSLGEKQDDKSDPWEVFDAVLQQQAKVISEEQNFIIHFFHLNSQSTVDFAEMIGARPPQQRELPSLDAQQSYDPDRNMAKTVQQVIDSIYSFWPNDLHGLVEWCLKLDQMQGVGLLCSLERHLATYEETNQEYITRTLRTIHERLTSLFHRFVDDQVKAIEETKVKVKKRKGIIPFMRIFPFYSAAIEAMVPADTPRHESLEARFIVNEAYTRILKAMWESLSFIAKDDPASSGAGGVHSSVPAGGDPEDKEALNYHILLIENMNHYLEEVDTHHIVVLEDWAEKARRDLYSHLTQYTDTVIRRPLGKWLDFLESTEALMKLNSDSISSISSKPSHSRSAAKKVLGANDAKEVRKGVETLKKRIEKHFGDVDDPSSMSRSLVARVYGECGSRYAHAFDRMKAIVDKVYEGSLEIDWKKEEVVGMFKR